MLGFMDWDDKVIARVEPGLLDLGGFEHALVEGIKALPRGEQTIANEPSAARTARIFAPPLVGSFRTRLWSGTGFEKASNSMKRLKWFI
jgi:hypothetical protein